jgi:hypothetical protein
MLLPTEKAVFSTGETKEIIGQARERVRVVSLFIPSHEAFDFEVLDVIVRDREAKPEGQRSERSLFAAPGTVSGVLFTETNFRAPRLGVHSVDATVHSHEEVVAMVRNICTVKDATRILHLTFELGEF